MTDINDKQYHHNLHQSFSDGFPRWQNVNKEFQFYTGKENVNILGSHRFHTGKKSVKLYGVIDLDHFSTTAAVFLYKNNEKCTQKRYC
jgi:hypothetical protein